MNWITTNIRLPEDVYMDLKITAAKQRRSVASVVREKLGVGRTATNKEDLWERMDKFAKKIAKKYPNTRLSEKLIEMRYSEMCQFTI